MPRTKAPRKRAPRGSGSVYQRTDRDGYWIAEIKSPTRQRRQFSSRAAANAWLASQNPTAVSGGKITLAAWLDEWNKSPSRSPIDPATVSFYRQMASVWKTTPLARRSINTITPVMIEDQLDEWVKSGHYARTTASHLRRVLGTALNMAVRAGRLTVNPVPAVTLSGRPAPNRVRQIRISDQAVRDLSDAWLNHPLRAAFELSLHTGLRPAELLCLTWNDLRIADATVSVRRAIKARRILGKPTEWKPGDPKTAASNRDVSFDPEIKPILFAYRDRMGKPAPSSWVFPGADGKPMVPDNLSRAFRRVVDEAGVSVRPGEKRSEFRLYDLRAIHASLLLAGGVDPMAVAVRLGHTDVVSTMRRYAGYVSERDRAAAEMSRVWDAKKVPLDKKERRTAESGVEG